MTAKEKQIIKETVATLSRLEICCHVNYRELQETIKALEGLIK